MTKSSLALVACFMVLPRTATVLGANQPVQQSPEATVKALVDKLASEDPAEREQATWGLEGDSVNYDDVAEMQKQLDAGDLSPEQQHRLEGALKYIKPRADHWVARQKGRADVDTARLKMMTDAYNRDGHTDPKWDADVRRMFDLRLKQSQVVSDRQFHKLLVESATVAKTAMDAGCDDPDFLAEAGLTLNDAGTITVNLWELFGHAKDHFDGNHVSPLARTIILGRVIRSEVAGYDGGYTPGASPKVMDQLKDMITTYQGMASVPGIDPRIVVDVADNIWGTGKAMNIDQVSLFRNVDPSLARLAPTDPTRLCIKGDYFVAWAYVARGTGWANTVTEQGWKDFNARVAQAAKAYTAAYDADPLCTEAAEQMIMIEMFRDNGRDEMEKWFDRAMDISLNPVTVVNKKSYYLEPKWRGSRDDMLQFAHECMQRDQGRTAVTIEPLNAHITLSKMTPDPDGYMTDAVVYADVNAACSLYLKRHPDDSWIRCWYAKLACLNEDWKTADTQFKKIGPSIGGNAFSSQEEADRLAAKAARLAKQGE